MRISTIVSLLLIYLLVFSLQIHYKLKKRFNQDPVDPEVYLSDWWGENREAVWSKKIGYYGGKMYGWKSGPVNNANYYGNFYFVWTWWNDGLTFNGKFYKDLIFNDLYNSCLGSELFTYKLEDKILCILIYTNNFDAEGEDSIFYDANNQGARNNINNNKILN
jgi:hypothetical protein